jgi:uncharacterized membrane-anchored protein
MPCARPPTDGAARRKQAELQRHHPVASLSRMIAATTGDTLSMTFDLGLLVSTLIFASVLGILYAR